MEMETIFLRANSSLRSKIAYSIELLRKAEHLAQAYDPDNGYYLAFSGGKDSQALFHVAQLAGVRFKAHMNLTSVDFPEVIRFVKKQYPEVELIKPQDSIYNVAVRKNCLPTKRVRWCCAEFKENAGTGKVTLIGIRHAESSRRAKRKEVEISHKKFSGTLEELDDYRNSRQKKNPKGINITNATGERTLGCISGKETLIISPIIHWTDKDVWTFLNDVVRVPHCELYDKGFTRIGCILCPMGNIKNKRAEEALYPHVKRNWLKAIRKIRVKEGIGKREYAHLSLSESDISEEQENQICENIYDWWISGKAYKKWYADKFIQQKINF